MNPVVIEGLLVVVGSMDTEHLMQYSEYPSSSRSNNTGRSNSTTLLASHIEIEKHSIYPLEKPPKPIAT